MKKAVNSLLIYLEVDLPLLLLVSWNTFTYDLTALKSCQSGKKGKCGLKV